MAKNISPPPRANKLIGKLYISPIKYPPSKSPKKIQENLKRVLLFNTSSSFLSRDVSIYFGISFLSNNQSTMIEASVLTKNGIIIFEIYSTNPISK